MTIEFIKKFLWYNVVIHFVLLLLMFIMILVPEPFYSIQSLWYHGSIEDFVNYMYYAMLIYKAMWLFLNVVPYVALRIIEKQSQR